MEMKTRSIKINLTKKQVKQLEPIRGYIEKTQRDTPFGIKMLTVGYVNFHNVPMPNTDKSYLEVALFRNPESLAIQELVNKRAKKAVKLIK